MLERGWGMMEGRKGVRLGSGFGFGFVAKWRCDVFVYCIVLAYWTFVMKRGVELGLCQEPVICFGRCSCTRPTRSTRCDNKQTNNKTTKRDACPHQAHQGHQSIKFINLHTYTFSTSQTLIDERHLPTTYSWRYGLHYDLDDFSR